MNAPDHLSSDVAEASAEVPFWQQFRTTPWIDLLRGRMSCRLDVAALVAASGLPSTVREHILGIVRRTRLWRFEKVAVATELIAHFADGVDTGASVDHLLESFGDLDTTAKLIRRAKVRCRPWSWHVAKYMGQALVCLFVLYTAAIFYYAMGTPNIAVDYVAKLNEPALAAPVEDRAWPLYRQALLSLDRQRLGALADQGGLSPDDPSWGEVVEFVQASQSALETVRLAAAKPHFGAVRETKIREEDRELWPEQYERTRAADSSSDFEIPTMAILLPYVDELRSLGLLLAWDARLAAQRAEGDRVVEDMEAILGIARQLSGTESPLIEQLVGMAITRHAIEALGSVLRDGATCLTDDHLRRLAHRLAADDVAPVISLETERMLFGDIVQRIYTDNGRGDGHLLPRAQSIFGAVAADAAPPRKIADAGDYLLSPLANAGIASRKEMAAKHEEILERLAGRYAQPHWETRLTPEPVEEWLGTTSMIGQFRHALVAILTPALEQTHRSQQSIVGIRDGVLTALALEAYRRQHGQWPESLQPLVPDILPSVPRDRMTGDALRYRVVDGQAVVYSVGRDLDDDGGLYADVPARYVEIPAGADPATIERIRIANGKLKDETPRARHNRSNRSVSPRGENGEDAPDGDWILWHSAEGAVEREVTSPKQD